MTNLESIKSLDRGGEVGAMVTRPSTGMPGPSAGVSETRGTLSDKRI